VRWLHLLFVVPALVGCSGPGEEATPTQAALATRPGATATVAGATAAPSPTQAVQPRPPEATQPAPATQPAQPTSAAQPTQPALATQPPAPANVSLRFVAKDLKFDRTSVTVPRGATVTATLQNDDTGVEHNLTFSLPGLPHGETCAGPCTRTQTFQAPAAGSYFFLCTIHDMSGAFVVQ